MAAHGFTEAQIEFIRSENTNQADALRRDIEPITTSAQSALAHAQTEIPKLMAEATQNAGRVDQGVTEMKNLKDELNVKVTEIDAKSNAIVQRIADHEEAILTSSQAAQVAGSTDRVRRLCASH